MPREFTRSDRVSDAIQRILGQVIAQEIRDRQRRTITGDQKRRDNGRQWCLAIAQRLHGGGSGRQ